MYCTLVDCSVLMLSLDILAIVADVATAVEGCSLFIISITSSLTNGFSSSSSSEFIQQISTIVRVFVVCFLLLLFILLLPLQWIHTSDLHYFPSSYRLNDNLTLLIRKSSTWYHHIIKSTPTNTKSAIFHFESLLLVILLLICTCTYIRSQFSSLLSENKGFLGLFWKASRIGKRNKRKHFINDNLINLNDMNVY